MSSTHKPLPPRLTMPASIAVFGVTLSLLAGCGGSSSPKTVTQQARPTPAQSIADVGRTYSPTDHARQTARGSTRAARVAPSQKAGSLRGVQGAGIQRATPTPTTSNDDAAAPPARFNPCTLVSVPEAQAIVGAALTGRAEAPLGPTCIYKLSGSKSGITIAVESLSLSQVTHNMARPKTLIVDHRRAYCGRLGEEMLFAPLAKGRVLNVTAPCAIAQRFAALALARVTA